MIKRKLLMTILPVLSAAVIAGAGFSAWHFGGTVDNNEMINIGTVVTNANDGSVTVATKDTAPQTLTLDQGTNGSSYDLGITFNTNWAISVTFPTATSYSNYTIKLEVKIADSLANYVTLVGTNNSSVNSNFTTEGVVSDKTTLTFTSNEIDVDAGRTVEYTFALNNGGNTHNNVMNYTSKPQTYDTWSTMYTALNSQSNLVTLTATVDAN